MTKYDNVIDITKNYGYMIPFFKDHISVIKS